MNKFVLSPRANLANMILLFLLAISALMSLYMAFSTPVFGISFVISLLLIAGVFLKHPVAYIVIMVSSFIGVALALKNASLADAAIDAACVALAFYIRSNLYFLKEPLDEASQIE